MMIKRKKQIFSLALASVIALSSCPVTSFAQEGLVSPASVEEEKASDLISKEEAAVISVENNMPVGELYDKPLVTDENIKEIAKSHVYELLNMEGEVSHYLVIIEDGYSLVDAKKNGEGFIFTKTSTETNNMAEKVKLGGPLYISPTYEVLTKEEFDKKASDLKLISKEEAAVIFKENNMPAGQLYEKPLVSDDDIKEMANNSIYALLNMEGEVSHYLVIIEDGYSLIDAKKNGEGFIFTTTSTEANKMAEKVKLDLPLYITPSYKILTKEELDREVELQDKRDKERSKPKQVEVLYNSVNINLNGQLLDMDNLLYKSTTYVPLRDIAKVSGAEVSWDGASHTAKYLYDEGIKQSDPIEKEKLEFSKKKPIRKSVNLLEDYVIVTYNGKTAPLSLGTYDRNNELFPSIPTLLYEGKTYVPLRFMSLVNKQTVSWDQKTYTVSVYDKKEN